MNSIPTEQNTERQLQRLAAQRQLYASAKRIFMWQLVISGPVAVFLAISVNLYPALKAFVALWGILVTIFDIVFLTPWQKRLRNRAAGVQEVFDCEVLSLPWNELKAGKRPDPELVKEQADKYNRRASFMPLLSDWYAKDIGCLPLHVARLICQRSNCWWDAKQRRRYAVIVVSSVISISVAVFFFAMSKGFTLEDFVLKVMAPLSPALLLGYRQFIEQMEAAVRLDNLKEHAERLWGDTLAGKPEFEVTDRSRVLQDEILESRRKSPLVFDALFKQLRFDYEIQMDHGASALILEAKQKFKIL